MKTLYYVLVTKKGNPACHNERLPIYWNKQIAIRDGIEFENEVKRIRIVDLKKIIQ